VWDAHPFFSAKADDIIHKYSWDITARHPWDLWSMPSSHTALAAVMSVFLASLYPRLRPFCLAMVVLVGCCRVLFRDHYPTDVVVGAVVGHVIASHVIAASWGRRVIAWGMPKRRSAKAPPKALPVSVEGGRYAK
jgi:membrane-associated phospholipid phosphatase